MKLSVCMASYNGEKYIREQIQSILDQTIQVDEICIIDDCSSDRTVEIVREFNSDLITIELNKKNLGYVRSFEKSIQMASGQIIFLSDQDDIWSKNKVEVVLEEFKKNSDVMLICHDAKLVDSDNREIYHIDIHVKPGLYKKLSLLREFVKPRIYGCVSVFRSELNSTYLPFNKFVYTHDHWLAINAFLRGGCLVISDKLINYRRHDQVLTQHKRRSIYKLAISRLKFLAMCLMATKSILINRHNWKKK